MKPNKYLNKHNLIYYVLLSLILTSILFMQAQIFYLEKKYENILIIIQRETIYPNVKSEREIIKQMPKFHLDKSNNEIVTQEYDYQTDQYEKLLKISAPKEREWINTNEKEYKEKLNKKQQLENKWLENHLK